MRVIDFCGYIEDEKWFDDDITPESLRMELYGETGQNSDDVLLRINSYGGSTVAAARMYDLIREYPGNVDAVISGVAASAATVVASAARNVRMSPGSLYMVHDPATFAFGNEKDLGEAITLLKAVKEGILNIYEAKCNGKTERGVLAKLMADTSWLSANEAHEHGFIDEVTTATTQPVDSVPNDRKVVACADIDEAKRKVAAYFDRQKPQNAQRSMDAVRSYVETRRAPSAQPTTVDSVEPAATEPVAPTVDPSQEEKPTGTPVALLKRKLDLYK